MIEIGNLLFDIVCKENGGEDVDRRYCNQVRDPFPFGPAFDEPRLPQSGKVFFHVEVYQDPTIAHLSQSIKSSTFKRQLID